MSHEHEVHARQQDGVLWITLDRPDSRNGLTIPAADRMTDLLTAGVGDPDVRVIVVTGAGGAFCSGADIKYATLNNVPPDAGLAAFQRFVRALRASPKPTLAAIDGAAAGFGADIALACDLRLASDRARLGQRFVGIGLMPDGGSTWLLPRIVGLGRALEMIYSGRMIDPQEGERIGLFNLTFPADAFTERVQAYAATLALGPPLAFAEAKRAVHATYSDFDDALQREAEGQLRLLASQDFAEGVQAFIAKRPPSFQGR